jgi:hypothetical protein
MPVGKRGATLIAVVAVLAMVALLGAQTWASHERSAMPQFLLLHAAPDEGTDTVFPEALADSVLLPGELQDRSGKKRRINALSWRLAGGRGRSGLSSELSSMCSIGRRGG